MLRSISFHPSGDFILVGTQHPTLRLYDINTFQCFVSCNPQDQHTDAICSVNYNASANMYVTGSKDGCIKLWDGVSNRCITTFEKAHDGAEVCSAIFSKNSKYILSSGKDSVAKLWEISTGRTLVKYTGMYVAGDLAGTFFSRCPWQGWKYCQKIIIPEGNGEAAASRINYPRFLEAFPLDQFQERGCDSVCQCKCILI